MALAVFVTEPASTSDCFTAYDTSHATDAAGASVAIGDEKPHGDTIVAPPRASVTATSVSVTLPVFSTVTVHTTGSPALAGAPLFKGLGHIERGGRCDGDLVGIGIRDVGADRRLARCASRVRY